MCYCKQYAIACVPIPAQVAHMGELQKALLAKGSEFDVLQVCAQCEYSHVCFKVRTFLMFVRF